MTRVSVLLSARDPGAAAQVREIAPVLRADRRLEVVVVASDPAYELLVAAGEEPRKFTASASPAAAADTATLVGEAHDVLDDVDPDVVVTGISSLGVGVDEALLACAGTRPTFALQDYPGDVNALGHAYAATYFVRDEPAAALTVRRFSVRAVAVGSLRHAGYSRLDVRRLREDTRRAAKVDDGRPVIGFFGQPPAIPGQETAFGHLVDALRGRMPRPFVIHFEHPKSLDRRDAHVAMLRSAGLTVHDATGATAVEPWLAACDVVATCFSHCTMDYAFLTAWSAEPLGAVLFLMTTPEITRFLHTQGGLAVPDGAERGLGRIVRTPTDVVSALDEVLAESTRRQYHLACRQLPKDVAFRTIVDAVVEGGLRRRAAIR
ncbi:MAG: hypothetical protein HYU41_15755 [Candidatus Rokubacteria bacterium]|nr:hypothetical protein [Candidatus Rokubacteria bacterium]